MAYVGFFTVLSEGRLIGSVSSEFLGCPPVPSPKCGLSLVMHTAGSHICMQSPSQYRTEPEVGRKGGQATGHILVLSVPLFFIMELQGAYKIFKEHLNF